MRVRVRAVHGVSLPSGIENEVNEWNRSICELMDGRMMDG